MMMDGAYACDIIMDGTCTCDICRAESRPVDDYTALALEEVCFASVVRPLPEHRLYYWIINTPVPVPTVWITLIDASFFSAAYVGSHVYRLSCYVLRCIKD